jgi:predicted Zn finger-like uncharacterized protein
MQINCSNCQSKIRVPDSAAGKKGKCPKCGTIIAIPALDESDEATAEPVVESPAEATAEPVSETPPSFNFAAEPAPSRKAGRRDDDDDAVGEGLPPRKNRSRAADEEEVAADDAEAFDDDKPRRKKNKEVESPGLSITSLVLGIVSVLSGCGGFGCCCFAPVSLLCAIGAVVTGFLGMKKGGKVLAIVGMSLGGFSLLLALGGIIFAFVGTGFQAMMNMAGMR